MCQKHYNKWYHFNRKNLIKVDRPIKERIELLLSKILVEDSGCWTWLGCLDKGGYGVFCVTIAGFKKTYRAHRIVYETFKAKIPDGLVLDHLCRNRSCVNPEHLEPVTIKENTRRGLSLIPLQAEKTRCNRGHLLENKNLYLSGRKRSCCACRAYNTYKAYNKKTRQAIVSFEDWLVGRVYEAWPEVVGS